MIDHTILQRVPFIAYEHNGAVLMAPASYINATDEHREAVCNGMGPKGKGFLVPDTMYLLDLEEPGNIHDWTYEYAQVCGWSRMTCDSVFLHNMMQVIRSKNDTWYNRLLMPLRQKRALKYHFFVRQFGAEHFKGEQA